MLRNKIVVKKIRNIFILIMTIIIMLGAYQNIRRSRAEKVIEISMEVIDKDGNIENQTITSEATETSDGIYLLELPKLVNTNMVTKYYTAENEEIIIDEQNNNATLQLTESEVSSRTIQLWTDYDKKTVRETTVNGATIQTVEQAEEKTFYKREISNENGEVVATGYMPLNAELEISDIDTQTLTNVKKPSETQTIKKAFTVSIYENQTETQNTEKAKAETEEVQNEETQAEENQVVDEQAQATEKVTYNPNKYGEIITIKTKYNAENANERGTIYNLENSEQTEAKEIETTKVETNDENSNEQVYQFDTNELKTETKYILATEQVENSDVAVVNEDSANDSENVSDEINSDTSTVDTGAVASTQASTASTAGGTAGVSTYLRSASAETEATSAFLGNSSLQRQDIENVTFTNKLVNETPIHSYDASKNTGSSFSTSTTSWKDLKGSMNGTVNGGTWGTDSDGSKYLNLNGSNQYVKLGEYNPTDQVKLDVVISANSIQSGEHDIISNFDYGGYGLYLASGYPTFDILNDKTGGYVSIKSGTQITANKKTHIVGTYDGINLMLYVDDVLVAQAKSEGTIRKPTDGIPLTIGCNPDGSTGAGSAYANIKVYSVDICDKVYFASSYDASGDNTNSYDSTSKFWKDIKGHYNGTIIGDSWTWGSDYLSLGGNDWVNLGTMSFNKVATIEATITLDQIQSEGIVLAGNIDWRRYCIRIGKWGTIFLCNGC